jgi:flavin-binding protein dodecin
LFFIPLILPSLEDVELVGSSRAGVTDGVKDEVSCATEVDVDDRFFKVRKKFVILLIIAQE